MSYFDLNGTTAEWQDATVGDVCIDSETEDCTCPGIVLSAFSHILRIISWLRVPCRSAYSVLICALIWKCLMVMPLIVSFCEFTMNTDLTTEPTVDPTTSTPSPTSSSFHYVAPGDYALNEWSNYATDDYKLCTNDLSNQSNVSSTRHDYDISASCCTMDGSTGLRPDCSAHPVTYAAAVQLCNSHGYRLCTLQEMLWDRLTDNDGCDYDGSYNWVSTECNNASSIGSGLSMLFMRNNFL